MKRLFALFLIISVLFSLSACQEENQSVSEKTQSSLQHNQDPEPTKPEETTAPETKKREFALGKVSGQNYENTFIGIGCNLPQHWKYSTERELLQVNGLSGTSIGQEEQEALKKISFFHDMNAGFQGQFPCVYVYMEKKSIISMALLTIEGHYQEVLDSFTQTLNQDGVQNVTGSVEEIQFDGQAVPCLQIKAKISGMVYYWTVICFKCNNYVATVEIITINKSDARDIVNCFYWLEE